MFDGDHDGGATPGYIGIVCLDAAGTMSPVRLRNFRMCSGNLAYASGGDPTNDAERFACLDGTAPQSLPEEWRDRAEPAGEAERARLVADYIAGMTDRYALEEHAKLFDPYART